MIKDRTPKEDIEMQNAHEMEKYDNSMPHEPDVPLIEEEEPSPFKRALRSPPPDYVTVKVPFKEVKDEETGMITRNYDVTGIETQLCKGWDVDASEDGCFIVKCDCNQCVNLENRQNGYIEDWEFYHMEDLR